MPRYSSDPVAWPGTEMVPDWPVRVFDGNGVEIDRCCVVDTDTGEVTAEVFDSKGRPVVDWVNSEIVRATWFAPLPIRLEPVPRGVTVPTAWREWRTA